MKPCPFCGATLKPILAGNGRDVVSYGHPSNDCLLRGWAIGAQRIDRWDVRVPGVWLEINEENIPNFNDEGRGIATGAGMVNDIVDYYRSYADAQIRSRA